MDTKRFQTAFEAVQKLRRSSSPEERNRAWEELKEAATPDHVGKSKSFRFSDSVSCSCGWESPGYWDLLEAAWDDWAAHVADTCGIIPRRCPCGKTYTPIEGGTPCHKLEPL